MTPDWLTYLSTITNTPTANAEIAKQAPVATDTGVFVPINTLVNGGVTLNEGTTLPAKVIDTPVQNVAVVPFGGLPVGYDIGVTTPEYLSGIYPRDVINTPSNDWYNNNAPELKPPENNNNLLLMLLLLGMAED